MNEFELEKIESIESEAQAWGQEHHPAASPQHHAAFVNSVVYALLRFTGRYGGPSVREHAASAALNESDIVEWSQRPREELYWFLDPVVYGPLSDLHIRTWIMLRDISFDNDPADVSQLEVLAHDFKRKDVSSRYETMRVWPQSLRKLRMIAAMRNESVVESIDRLANEEFARLRHER